MLKFIRLCQNEFEKHLRRRSFWVAALLILLFMAFAGTMRHFSGDTLSGRFQQSAEINLEEDRETLERAKADRALFQERLKSLQGAGASKEAEAASPAESEPEAAAAPATADLPFKDPIYQGREETDLNETDPIRLATNIRTLDVEIYLREAFLERQLPYMGVEINDLFSRAFQEVLLEGQSSLIGSDWEKAEIEKVLDALAQSPVAAVQATQEKLLKQKLEGEEGQLRDQLLENLAYLIRFLENIDGRKAGSQGIWQLNSHLQDRLNLIQTLNTKVLVQNLTLFKGGYFQTDPLLVQGARLDPVLEPIFVSRLRQENQILQNFHHVYRNESFERMANILNTIGLGSFFFFLIVLAASSVSSELSKGTIKALIITPCKRWKLLAAKFLALALFLLGGIIFFTLVSFGISSLAEGYFATGPRFFTTGAVSWSLPILLSYLLENLLWGLDAFALILFALMLSTLLRSTSLAVSLGILGYLGSSGLSTLFRFVLNPLGNYVFWFLPYSHMSWSARVLGQAGEQTLYNTLSLVPPLGFSLAYYGLLALALYWLAHDAFCRRDIQ